MSFRVTVFQFPPFRHSIFLFKRQPRLILEERGITTSYRRDLGNGCPTRYHQVLSPLPVGDDCRVSMKPGVLIRHPQRVNMTVVRPPPPCVTVKGADVVPKDRSNRNEEFRTPRLRRSISPESSVH